MSDCVYCKNAQLSEGLRVLDLGCGTGYFSALLRERGAQVVCADISHAMLEQAKQRCGDEGMSYQLADAEQLPFASACLTWYFKLSITMV